nr:unnamed protein product [Callosobruchus analis]
MASLRLVQCYTSPFAMRFVLISAFLGVLARCGAAKIHSEREHIESPHPRFIITSHGTAEDYLPEPEFLKLARRSDRLPAYQQSSDDDSQEPNYPSYEYERKVQGTIKQRRVTVKKPPFVEQYLKEVTPTTNTFASKVDRSRSPSTRSKPAADAVQQEQADESLSKSEFVNVDLVVCAEKIQRKMIGRSLYWVPSMETYSFKQDVEPHFQFDQEEPRGNQAPIYVPTVYQNDLLTHRTQNKEENSSPRSIIHVTQTVPKKHIRKIVKPKQSATDEDLDYYSRLQQLQQLQQKHAKAHSHAYEPDKGEISHHFHPEENTEAQPDYVQHLAQYQQEQLKHHPAPVKYQAKLAHSIESEIGRYNTATEASVQQESAPHYQPLPEYERTSGREGKRANIIKYRPVYQNLADGLEYTAQEQSYEAPHKAPGRLPQYQPTKVVEPPRYGHLPRPSTLIYPDEQDEGGVRYEPAKQGPRYLPNAKTAEEEKYQPAAFSKSKTIRFQKGNGEQVEYEQVNLPVQQQQVLARYEVVAAKLQEAARHSSVPKQHYVHQEPRYSDRYREAKYLPSRYREAKLSGRYHEPKYQQDEEYVGESKEAESADEVQYRQPHRETQAYQSNFHRSRRPSYFNYEKEYE